MVIKKIILLLLIIAASLLVGFLTPGKTIAFIHQDAGYHLIFFSFFLWVAWLVKLHHRKLKSVLRQHYGGGLSAVVLMALIFCIAPPRFKILADETNLIGISMAMYQSKQAVLPLKGVDLDYRKPDYTTTIDKRPLLYPLLVSFVHSLRGYSPSNGFILNFILGIGVLFVLYLFVCDLFSPYYAYLAILATASLPVFVTWVTSSGFETLNLFFIVFTLFLFNRVYTRQSIPHAELLFLTLVLLAQCRYESVVFTVAVLFLLPMLLNKKSISRLSIITYLIPMLFIPVIWLPRLYADLPDINRINEALIYTPSLYDAFSFSNLIANSPKNLMAFSGLDPHLGFTPVISVLAGAGAYLLTKNLITNFKNQSPHYKSMWLYACVTLALLYVIQFSFYRGDLTLYTQNRFAMTYLPFMVLPAIFLVHSILNKTKTAAKILVVIFFIFHLIYFWPFGSQQLLVNGGSIPNEYNKTLRFIERNFKDHSAVLVICERPNLYLVQYRGALDFKFANQHANKILNEYGREFDHILVLQKYRYKTGQPMKSNRISKSFPLISLGRVNLTQSEYFMISEIRVQ